MNHPLLALTLVVLPAFLVGGGIHEIGASDPSLGAFGLISLTLFGAAFGLTVGACLAIALPPSKSKSSDKEPLA